MGPVASRAAGFIHIRLIGRVSCRAYGIGPAAVRLGKVTIVIADRMAALSVVTAALFFEEVAPKLGHTYPNRFGRASSPGTANDLTALVAFNGTQELRDQDLTPAYSAQDRCGEASVTIGNVRVSVCDRDAAERVAKALGDAYGEAAEAYARLRPLGELRQQQESRRTASRERRMSRI